MRRPPIQLVRRLVLVVVVGVCVALALTYGVRRWRLHKVRQDVDASLPQGMQQRAEGFRLSRTEAGQGLFTLEAARAIEREGRPTVLEHVSVVLHGRRGGRADRIRTGRCEYDAGESGEIYCPGAVTFELRGVPGQEEETGEQSGSPGRWIRLETSRVRFDPVRSVAWTEQPVSFAFPQGRGEAVGLQYQPQEPEILLKQRVRIVIDRGGNGGLRVSSSDLRFYARARVLELSPPLEVKTESAEMAADSVRMTLRKDFETETIQAQGKVRARRWQDGREQNLQAREVVAYYTLNGRVERLVAAGEVLFVARRPGGREQVTSNRTVLQFDAVRGRVERVTAEGDAEFVSSIAGEVRRLSGPALVLQLDIGSRGDRLLQAPRGGELRVQQNGAHRSVVAQLVELRFERDVLRALRASQNVRTETTEPGRGTRATQSDELRTEFGEAGQVVSARQWGAFSFRSDQWQANAQQATYRAEGEVFRLEGTPSIWDQQSRTQARVIEIREAEGILQAEGDVRSTRQSRTGQPAGLGPGPVHLTAEGMEANDAEGWVRYEGNARLWQAEDRLAADVIELFREPARLQASGNVKALLAERTGPDSEEEPPSGHVNVTSDRFSYIETERRGVFEQNVTAQGSFGALYAPKLEVFLAATGSDRSERIERAYASGGTRIVRPDETAVSEHAEYRLASETITLWGGNPTVTDSQGQQTSGARLTLFLANDRLLVESEQDTRTVTRRPRTR